MKLLRTSKIYNMERRDRSTTPYTGQCTYAPNSKECLELRVMNSGELIITLHLSDVGWMRDAIQLLTEEVS